MNKEECSGSGQEKLATVLFSSKNNRSDSFGVKPPLYNLVYRSATDVFY